MDKDFYIDLSLKIVRLLGIHFPENRWTDLERGLTAAAKDLQIDESIESIGKWLAEPGPSAGELQILSSHLTIGETYFFRENNALDFFRNQILPQLILERTRDNREIRIWSAGCSSGEEAYTIAILLKESASDLKDLNISILATDINPVALKKAKLGVYSRWSFRETIEEMKHKYFSAQGSNWEISPEIRKMVTFLNVNLAGEFFPVSSANAKPFDVIFCRNVLMYFTPEKACEVAQGFFNSLNDKGWLITSQVELNEEYFNLFSRKQYRNGFYYQKVPRPDETGPLARVTRTDVNPAKIKVKVPISAKVRPAEPTLAEIKKVKVPDNQTPAPETLFSQGQYLACSIECERLIRLGIRVPALLMLLVRSQANLGNLQEARIGAEKLIALNGIHAEAHHLFATILLELNQLSEAEIVLKRALYLEPDHLPSHLTLANVLKRLGKKQLASKYFRMAGALLERLPDEEVVPDTGGLTAGRLRDMINR